MAMTKNDMDDEELARQREAGELICQCTVPAGPDDGECATCWRLIHRD